MPAALRLMRPDKIDTQVQLPGSKSYTNRALVMAALSSGESTLVGASESDDSRALCAALTCLGVSVTKTAETITVRGVGASLAPYRGAIDVGPAGTTMRFLVPLCAATPGAEIVLRGSDRMHQRPIRELVDALRQLGAEITYLGLDGCPPLRISGRQLHGGSIEMKGNVSSQFFSALLLAAPLFGDGLEVVVRGPQISRSYIDMTLAGMRGFGITAANDDYRRYSVARGVCYAPTRYFVEGDGSGASYLFAIAAIGGGRIRVHNINPNSVQGDILFPELLAAMGCEMTSSSKDAGWIEIRGPQLPGASRTNLRAIQSDMTLLPDTAQTLAVVAAVAEGRSELRGLSTLRVKETDRISALETELAKFGIGTASGPDYLTIDGNPNLRIGKPISIATYDDHRMAMSFAALAARFSDLIIEHPLVVNKSFPTFWQILSSLGITAVPA